MSDDYASERTYVFLDSLENGDCLFKTEYGSLLTEAMLKEWILAQFEGARRHLVHRGKQQLRLRFEVTDTEEQP